MMLSLRNMDLYLNSWLAQRSHHRLMTSAIHSAYTIWSRRFPRWVNAGFDEYFLQHDAKTLLISMTDGHLIANPAQLARAWAKAYNMTGAQMQKAIADCTPAAADFLYLLASEYRYLMSLATTTTSRTSTPRASTSKAY